MERRLSFGTNFIFSHNRDMLSGKVTGRRSRHSYCSGRLLSRSSRRTAVPRMNAQKCCGRPRDRFRLKTPLAPEPWLTHMIATEWIPTLRHLILKSDRSLLRKIFKQKLGVFVVQYE
jgi:hypothetical protein